MADQEKPANESTPPTHPPEAGKPEAPKPGNAPSPTAGGDNPAEAPPVVEEEETTTNEAEETVATTGASGKGGNTNKTKSDLSGLIVSGVVWLVIMIFAFWSKIAPENDAHLVLELKSQPQQTISGIVQWEGAAVSNGTVHLVVADAKDKHYRSSAIVPVGPDGRFTSAERALLESEDLSKPLRITAQYTGQTRDKEKQKEISGETALYLNFPVPMANLTAVGWSVLAAGVAFFLIMLFTGDLTRRKARVLFSVTYLMTIVSLVVPIATIILVARSQYLVEIMEQSPVGLVKGTAKGVQSPQWLVNLGGAVLPAQKIKGATESPQEAPPAAAATPAGIPSANKLYAESEQAQQLPGFAYVQGGLVVPFYVIILAMLGGGINMTKKVPDIQKRHDTQELPEEDESVVKSAWQAPIALFRQAYATAAKTKLQKQTVSGIRKELIDNYMGLISAPFLAIAVYYLLQIIATNIAEPVLVVVSFAIGFVSDSIVTTITKFATEMVQKITTNDQSSAKNPAP